MRDARSIVAWAAAGAGAALLAFGAGVAGLFGSPTTPAEFAPSVVAPVQGIALLDCPAGAIVGTAPHDERLFVIARSPDREWLAVRSADQLYRMVWIASSELSVDEFPITIDELPVRDCGAIELIGVTP